MRAQSRSRVAAVAGSVLGLSLVVSGCSGGSQSGDTAKASPSEAPVESSNGVRDASVWLWPQCGQRVESRPGLDSIVVDTSGSGRGREAGISVVEDQVSWGVVLDNQTDLVAVNVRYEFRVLGDGEDVTDQLGKYFQDSWEGGSPTLSWLGPWPASFGDDDINMPEGWEDLDLKLEAEVTGVDYWCTYEEY